jgi:hypothetical protein
MTLSLEMTPPPLLVHIVAFHESKVTDLIREGLLFITCVEASIILFNSSSLVLDITAYTRDFMCP